MHEHEARAEDRRLLVGLLGKPATADALGEAEVIADPCARASLSADRVALHDERIEALGRGVHGGCEASRSGTANSRIVSASDFSAGVRGFPFGSSSGMS